MIENHCTERGRWLESLLREVRVIQIPDIGVHRHPLGHLLEPQDGIGYSNAKVSSGLWVPADLCNRSLNWVGVLKYHHCLSRDVFTQMLWLLSTEVLLEQIYLIVLANTLLGP